jgi:hypothetical protein
MGAPLSLWLEALGLRASIPVLLRALPLDRVLTLLSLPARTPGPPGVARPAPSESATHERLRRVEALTDRITRRMRLTRSACLKRALLRYALLRREGLGPGFVIGVRPAASSHDGFEAHAWVCLDQAPVMEHEAPSYRPTFVWPPAAAPGRA